MKKQKTKPLSLPAFRRVVDDYRRIAMPRGQNISEFLRSRAIAPVRFYPTFLIVYRKQFEEVILKITAAQSASEQTAMPDIAARMGFILRIMLEDGNDEKEQQIRDMVATAAKHIIELEYLKEERQKKELHIQELEKINEEYNRLNSDMERNIEEQTAVDAEIERIYNLAKEGKASPEEIEAILDKKARIDRDTKLNESRHKDLRRRLRTLQ